MTRSANNTIKGFLYQFIKTLETILKSPPDSLITCEGIEDIDVDDGNLIEVVQCKYHEEVDNFVLSKVYKPIILMMEHYALNLKLNINYRLFAHFPNETEGNKVLTKQDCESILKTADKHLKIHVDEIKSQNMNIDNFLNNFTFFIGPSFDKLSIHTKKLLEIEGYAKDDIDLFIFPNLVYIISELSIKKIESERKISKKTILSQANDRKKILVNKWIEELDNFKTIIDNKRLLLKTNLNQNYRYRTFIFNKNLSNKLDDLICFIDDYLRKYHFKDIHTCEPIFCVSLSEETFLELITRIYKKGIIAEDGLVAGKFCADKFKKRPIINIIRRKIVDREFQIKILNYCNINVLNNLKPHDYYIFMEEIQEELDTQDVNTENFRFSSFNHIKYIFNLSGGY